MALPSWVPEIGVLCFSGTEPGTLFNCPVLLVNIAVMSKD